MELNAMFRAAKVTDFSRTLLDLDEDARLILVSCHMDISLACENVSIGYM